MTNIIWLDSCSSTNTELDSHHSAPAGTVVAARCQNAGRGQRGNSWEAEPGKNLTFSILLRPQVVEAQRQFEVSMLVALAVKDAINDALAAVGACERAAVKWPNDIYVGPDKICGILIENKLAGRHIERSIAGIGINVNQIIFRSDAPNPTSMAIITGREFNLEELLEDVTLRIEGALQAYEAFPDVEALNRRYFASLICTDGVNRFADADGEFTGHITAVAPDGIITVSNGKSYAFKELQLIQIDPARC